MSRIRLTSRIVARAACCDGKRKVELFDVDQRGFLLEVRASGGKTFYQRYTDLRGRDRQIRIGPADALTLAQARSKARQIVAAAFLGADPATERDLMREVPTFETFAKEKYLPHAESCKRSWKTDEIMLRVHILPELGRLCVDEIAAGHVDVFLTKMRAQNYAPGTIGRALVLLRHMFNLAQKWKTPGINGNPTAGFVIPPDVQRSRYLSPEEAARLIAAIRADQNELAAKAIMLLLLTGARRNEVTQARWDYLDWNKRTLLVPLSKSGRPRVVTLNSAAVEVLRSIEQVPGNPYIFPAQTTGRPSPHLFFPWDRIRKRAGLADLRLHDLRHSFASFLVNEGISLYQVQHLLGHANSRSTARYSHLAPQTLAETAETVASVLRLQRPQSDQPEIQLADQK